MSPLTSVQLYSVRATLEDDLDGTLASLAGIGLQHVEPYGFHQRLEEYRRALPAHGLDAPSGHAPLLSAESPEQILDAAVALGMRTVIDPMVPADRWQEADAVARTAERLNEMVELAAARELVVGYHNHAWELSSRIDGRHALEAFVDLLDPRAVLEVDTYWAAVGGADPAALLESLGRRVALIHVKDGSLDGDTSRQQPVPQGEVDVPAVLAAAPEATRVIEFDDYAGDVLEGIAASYAWLQENDR